MVSLRSGHLLDNGEWASTPGKRAVSMEGIYTVNGDWTIHSVTKDRQTVSILPMSINVSSMAHVRTAGSAEAR